MKAICGLDCNECHARESCAGCGETDGRPYGGTCVIAVCCAGGRCDCAGHSFEKQCHLKEKLIREFNDLNIPDMEKVTKLNALHGAYINLEYTLPSGQKVKLLDDSRVYLGNQMQKIGSSRHYGIIADEEHICVCEYSDEGADAEIIIYKKRR